MRIVISNNRSRLECPAKLLIKLRKHPLFAIRAKGAFFSPAFQSRRWDGYVRFITERGEFDTGKLPQVLQFLHEQRAYVDIEDQREGKTKAFKITRFYNGMTLFEYQYQALRAIKEYKVEGIRFPRGVLSMATNAGKTIICAGIYQMYRVPTVLFVNSKELLNQALEDIPKLLPGKVGWIASSKGIQWNDFMIVMVQTVRSKMEVYGPRLAKFKVVLVDECDLATSATYKKVLSYTYNAYVKIGLSGSAFADKRKKEKNEKLRGIFGEVIYTIKNKELMESGISSKVKVFFWNGNTVIKDKGDYTYEYQNGIMKSMERNLKVVKRAQTHVIKNRLPILIIVKNHEHIKYLLKLINKRANTLGHEFFGLRIDWVHHKREDRFEVVKKFTEGKIDIFIGSYILKRGKNFPLMRAIINAGGGDSIENVLQILGRATRKHDSKEYTVMDDFYDKGAYLRTHSYHRLITYKNEGVELNEMYDRKLL